MTDSHKGLIAVFARHPVAANLSMAIMCTSGVWALLQLNKQFFPDFTLGTITVTTTWSGANANDVESSITVPLEQAMRNVDLVKRISSTSREGVSIVVVEFKDGTDLDHAADQVKQEVDGVNNLPPDAEEPNVTRAVDYEDIAKLILAGGAPLRDLALLAREYERQLLDRGISKVTMAGLPSEEIAIQVPQLKIAELGLSLVDIGERLSSFSQDLPGGAAGRSESLQQIRFLNQRRGEIAFEQMPFVSDADGRELRLGDIAEVTRRSRSGQATLYYQDNPAIELTLFRIEKNDSLEAARILQRWLADVRPNLPAGVTLAVAGESWVFLQQRINLLLKNGAGGLILVVLILYLFTTARIAFWIAAGIPISILGMLCVYYFAGGTINMLSMFAMIMALGIIVDDAIVVGENVLTRYQRGAGPLDASVEGARHMLAPVIASSCTTVAAFLPLLILGGIFGAILGTIPTVVICVIAASLVECFFILPGHLHHSLRKVGSHRPAGLRLRLNRAFDDFREKIFRPLATAAVQHAWATVTFSLAAILITGGLVAGGWTKFTFFPSPEGRIMTAEVTFVSGTPQADVSRYLKHMKQTLDETERALGQGERLVSAAIVRERTIRRFDAASSSGDHYGSIWVELTVPDSRSVRNKRFIEEWQSRLMEAPGLEQITIVEETAGPPGRELTLELNGDDTAKVKAAAEALANHLSGIPGVSGIGDNMPYGNRQLVMELTPVGRSLGLTVAEIGRQLHAAYDGYVAQKFSEGVDDVEVRVVLPDRERNYLASLDDFPVILPGGGNAPLSSVATYHSQRGFDLLLRTNGKSAITIAADVDASVNNTEEITAGLAKTVLPRLKENHGITIRFKGHDEEAAQLLGEMKRGVLFGLILIYLVLSWVFSSYAWPLLVMSVIPLGLVGAIWGHLWMGLDLTILSLFGFFGLAGIVVNDSIILVTFYKKLRDGKMAPQQAVIEAACQRLRAVILTSLTTIAGLTPLLFETSLQAQFLIPMATTIAFGLAFASFIVLLMIPALLHLYESAAQRFGAGPYATGRHAETAAS